MNFPSSAAGRALLIVAALVLLNSALSFHNLWPTPWIRLRPELSIEVVFLVLALAAYSEWRGPPSRRALLLLAGIVTLLAFGRYFEVTAPALYGRPVNAYWDFRHLPNVAAMLAEAAPLGLVAAAVAGIVAVMALAFALVAAALATLGRAFAERRPRRATGAAAAVVVAVFAAAHGNLPVATLRWFSLPVTMTYYAQLRFVADALAAPPPEPGAAGRLDGRNIAALGGADVLVSFVESYGAAVFDEPELAEATRGGRERLARALDATGRGAVSAFVRSPTFGGVSWLAHASFMTGLDVTGSRQYDLLLTRDVDTLPRLFRQHGYRAVAVMPGLKQAWPEGAFYGFDSIHGEAELAWSGPEFGWWRIPDQFALARLDERELAAADRAPVFAFFPTINTHIPFRPTPPLQPDWPRVLSDAPFAAADVTASRARSPQWTRLRPAYAGAIDYTYRYWAAYLEHAADSRAVVVLIGDHQPAASVSGTGARWDVPVHVITRNAALAEQLRNAGFAPGLVPPPGSLGLMSELTGTLLAGFGGTAPPQRAGRGHQDGTDGGQGEQHEHDGP